MADASYDAVVVGGGHHGTIIACYLQHAGLQTAIFERQHELGGGACSEEYILPGYVGQPCAHRTRFYSHPAYEDFNLGEKGLEYIYPETGSGMVFDDETCYVGYSAWRVVDEKTGKSEYSPEWAERNWREVTRFSERDAETVQMLTDKYRSKWRGALNDFFWNPPKPWGEKDAIEMLFDDPVDGVDPVYQVMTVYQIACDLFESSAMRTYLSKTSMSTTTSHPNDVVSVPGLLFLYGVCFNFAPSAAVVGGTHNITHALQRAFSEMGGKFFVHHEVDKVLIENGTARGIRLTDGTEIEARKLVVADVDINQLVFKLMGEEYVSPKVARRVQNFNYDRANLFWGHIATHEPPKYKAASFNPDCDTLYSTNWGPNDPEYLVGEHLEELHSRAIPSKVHLLTIMDSHWDKTRAPEGKYIALVEQHTAPARCFSEREWLQMKKDSANEIVRQWQWYAPNMTWDNVIGIHVTTPYDTQNRNINMREGSWAVGAGFAAQMGRFRPIPELSGYRMPVKNLYICSAACHYGGGIGRSSSYNCFKVIADDFGLDKIWEKKGRAY